MNQKRLNSVLKVVRSKFPFITGLDFYEKIGTPRYLFIFNFDIDILHNMFPDEKLDYNYIVSHARVPNISHIFDDYLSFGDDLNRITNMLITSISDNQSYRILYEH
jgi:hypothetical protein